MIECLVKVIFLVIVIWIFDMGFLLCKYEINGINLVFSDKFDILDLGCY